MLTLPTAASASSDWFLAYWTRTVTNIPKRIDIGDITTGKERETGRGRKQKKRKEEREKENKRKEEKSREKKRRKQKLKEENGAKRKELKKKTDQMK